MAYERIDVPYFGSLQRGVTYESEDPLEEAWAQVGRLGTSTTLRDFYKPETSVPNWEELLRYAEIRIRQAVEFRAAASNGSLVTSPLPMYYSFLNLARALMALIPEKIPPKGHGLKYNPTEKLLDNSAIVTEGSFAAFCNAWGTPVETGLELSLGDSLSVIPEMSQDLWRRSFLESRAFPVYVSAYESGKIQLDFDPRYLDADSFRRNWQGEFPHLASCCELAPGGATLLVKDHVDKSSRDAISRFCYEMLEPDLIRNNEMKWYALSRTTVAARLAGPARYLVGTFILGSIVRYEPELLLEAASKASELHWLLIRFLQRAERFFPQLMLTWSHDAPVIL